MFLPQDTSAIFDRSKVAMTATPTASVVSTANLCDRARPHADPIGWNTTPGIPIADQWKALVTYPTCNLVALVDLPSGNIVDSMKINAGATASASRFESTGSEPVCPVEDFCDGRTAPPIATPDGGAGERRGRLDRRRGRAVRDRGVERSVRQPQRHAPELDGDPAGRQSGLRRAHAGFIRRRHRRRARPPGDSGDRREHQAARDRAWGERGAPVRRSLPGNQLSAASWADSSPSRTTSSASTSTWSRATAPSASSTSARAPSCCRRPSATSTSIRASCRTVDRPAGA